MYTRIYGAEEKSLNIPENYDGNAFREESAEPGLQSKDPFTDIPTSENEAEVPVMKKTESEGIFSGIFKKLPIQGVFGNLGIKSISSFKIGSEEILIVGIALFLFFSKGGDNELAFMLLLLLFVK